MVKSLRAPTGSPLKTSREDFGRDDDHEWLPIESTMNLLMDAPESALGSPEAMVREAFTKVINAYLSAKTAGLDAVSLN